MNPKIAAIVMAAGIATGVGGVVVEEKLIQSNQDGALPEHPPPTIRIPKIVCDRLTSGQVQINTVLCDVDNHCSDESVTGPESAVGACVGSFEGVDNPCVKKLFTVIRAWLGK